MLVAAVMSMITNYQLTGEQDLVIGKALVGFVH